LIHKTHPSNQAGKVNGVGGKVEVFETPAQGMSREYLEETGVITDPFDWEEFAKLSGDDWAVHCFRIFDDEAVESAKTMTEEEIFVDTLDAATYLKFFENASWLFYMALDVDLDRNVVDVTWD
jgi:8-oxo-dGTP diphosphatase